jgi:8-oxo-dGTP pyrophosphatase MutT (NUDIX family)|tara:strand:- start:161 stop:643 length:483 start_codon:yes stop_codon:yes gene_type:complete
MKKKMTIAELRGEIRYFMKEQYKNSLSAGVVVVKKDNVGWKYLALVKDTGEYDIPKGIREEGESNIECALRETYEESSISLSENDFKWGMISTGYGMGVAFIATTSQTPIIKPNPETGEIEHQSFKWVHFKDMIKNVQEFLKPAILWAENIIVRSDNGNL